MTNFTHNSYYKPLPFVVHPCEKYIYIPMAGAATNSIYHAILQQKHKRCSGNLVNLITEVGFTVESFCLIPNKSAQFPLTDFTFTVIRHPWHRLLSIWRHYFHDRPYLAHELGFCNAPPAYCSAADYLNFILSIPLDLLSWQLRPQSSIIAEYADKSIRPDLFCKLEKLRDDDCCGNPEVATTENHPMHGCWRIIREKTGLKMPQHLNKSSFQAMNPGKLFESAHASLQAEFIIRYAEDYRQFQYERAY